MSINSVGFGGSLFGQAVQNLNTQLNNLSTQLATGQKSTTYAGMGTAEGFAIAARSQLSQISAFTDTITNVNTTINAANTALQSLSSISGQVQSDAASTPQALNSSGQTIAQQNASTELSSIVGILNTQVGNNFIFSGSAINTPSVATANTIMNGNGTQAGLKQVIAERAKADGTTGLGRLVITGPSTATPNTVSVAEDVAGSPFGLKLSSISSSLTGSSVSAPSGSPSSESVTLGTNSPATNPNPGDTINFNFKLPDGTSATVQLTATNTNPPPTGSFTIGANPAATATNLNTALNTAVGTLANTTLVAASAVAAGNDFFDPSGTATGSVASTAASVPVTSSTLLSGAPGSNSVSPSFAAGDTLSVNSQTIQFYNSSTTPPTAAGTTAGTTYLDLATTTVGNLLGSIDTITGTGTPSTVSSGGVITLNDDVAGGVTISSSSSGDLAALGFSGTVTGAATAAGTAVKTAPSVISSTTALSGPAGSNSLTTSFAPGDTITVNGQTISFYNSTATLPTANAPGSALNTTYIDLKTATFSTLLGAVDTITGTSTPSTVSGGVVEFNSDSAASLNITSSNSAALSSLGFSSSPISAVQPPLRVSSNGNSLVNGSATTVAWYTGNSSSSPRGSETARVDSSITVQYGTQANEQAIRQQIEGVAVFAAVTVSPTGPNSAATVSALSSRISTNLTAQPGQQSISDIQTDYAAAQSIMSQASARQTQSTTQLQNVIDQTETVSTQEVASQLLALQNSLSASYEATSMLAGLTLTKFLPAGG
jgi:flagellar hook-associated protein 3 FlgL